jgi:hypothetical protein
MIQTTHGPRTGFQALIERQIRADRAGTHDDVLAAVGLADDDLNARHRRVAVGVERLDAVTDGPVVLLLHPRQEARHVYQGDQRGVEGIAGRDEPGGFLGFSDE